METPTQVLTRIAQEGFNSSHPVWPLAGLSFYQSSGGTCFGFRRQGDTILLALEPIPAQLVDWNEFVEAHPASRYLWVGIGPEWRDQIAGLGQWMRIGSEPWMDLGKPAWTGNRAKGVRAAKNQAIRAGVTVERILGTELATCDELLIELKNLVEEWDSRRLIHFGGFLNRVDPFADLKRRNYWIARDPEKKIQALLVATPIGSGETRWFIEDLIYGKDALRGCGELLVIEALTALKELGVKEASLGVVSSLDSAFEEPNPDLPRGVRLGLWMLGLSRWIYQHEGIELFRKRFKPNHWQPVYLGLIRGSGEAEPKSADWMRAFFALVYAFEPKLQVSLPQIRDLLLHQWKRNGLLACGIAVVVLPFLWINHGGRIPEHALSRFGFTATAPWSEWIPRSLISDFLFTDLTHWLTTGGLFLFFLWLADRSFPKRFLVPVILLTGLLDDFVNYLFLVMPFKETHPGAYSILLQEKSVGCSLNAALLAGLLIFQMKRVREPLFIGSAFVLLMMSLYTSSHFQWVLLKLNYLVFLMAGYGVGYARLEWLRRESRRTCKGKSAVTLRT